MIAATQRHARADAAAPKVLRHLRSSIMRHRPDWNALGPYMPVWFRARLRRIDPNLTLQFMPPRCEQYPDGVDAYQYPFGIWVICRKLRSTGWLHKKWVYGLYDEWGNPAPPTMELVHVIRYARDQWIRNNGPALERDFDYAAKAMLQNRADASKDRQLQRIAGVCSEMNMRDLARPRVFIPSRN